MIRIKKCSLLMIILALIALLLVISCNQGRSVKSGGADVGKGARVKEDPTKGPDNRDLNVKLNELILKFGLSDKEKQIVYKIQEVLYDPDIGSGEDVKTYGDLEFYNLLKDLGDRRVKEIVENYLKVDELYESAKNEFSQAIKNAIVFYFKGKLQNNFDNYKSSYALQLKRLFKDADANAVYAAFIANDYVDQVTRETEPYLNELAMYLESNHSKRIIELRNIVTSPSQGYKTYTDSEFNGLLEALGDLKVKQMVRAYNEVVAEYERLDGDFKSRSDVSCLGSLITKLSNAKEDLDNYIRSCFTVINDSTGTIDPDVPPAPDDLYRDMLNLGNFSDFKLVGQYLANSIKYKEMMKNLRDFQWSAVAIFDSAVVLSDPSVCASFFLGGLELTQLTEFVKLYVQVIDVRNAADEAVEQISDGVAGKEDLRKQFEDCKHAYEKYVLASGYETNDPQQFYAKIIMTSTYVDNFNDIIKRASKLSPKTESGTTNPDINSDVKPGSTT
ncbi:hypothetical protein bcCo53_001247 (plasmid) [Borrelia coriaceae]|nr:hypothetical protein [Borrelia coriaceae]UPA17078.1 hypothetical protein bcCo53_001247 [Borrelia coriaceae]